MLKLNFTSSNSRIIIVIIFLVILVSSSYISHSKHSNDLEEIVRRMQFDPQLFTKENYVHSTKETDSFLEGNTIIEVYINSLIKQYNDSSKALLEWRHRVSECAENNDCEDASNGLVDAIDDQRLIHRELEYMIYTYAKFIVGLSIDEYETFKLPDNIEHRKQLLDKMKREYKDNLIKYGEEVVAS